ncbi:hypothetical protein W911_04465 [Hyphomicrobium nitrativorans NL23]|uniref:Glycoside hydrolase family 9 domain-containing protein n=1 Tax=Hyphomicrobium nitrativorans NL23 TaxID=1029756 RepID=V5SJ18_9HYPH|nr:glycoside hydrolase family 9 protein [Hyphomicrobium nitrativorans]AHB49939.1 hypothetical protein W911_04465 [Hyphomicrobium nitrativorans NL23]
MVKQSMQRRGSASRFVAVAFGSLVCSIAFLGAKADAVAQVVHEITIATPSIIAIEVRDPPFESGSIEQLAHPSSSEQGTWIKVGRRWGMVIGPDRAHVRISDTPPAVYLDRAGVDDASRYGEIAGGNVTSVFRKSVPYDSGIYRGPNGDTRTGASLKHYIYLKLSQPLSEGSHTIRWPSGTLPDSEFEYAGTETRAIAIRANQNGYRATDAGKVAYLSLWLPGGPAEGAVDFREFGLKAFHIIDETGAAHFSSSIRLRSAPSDPEPGNGLPAPLLEYPSASQSAIRIDGMDAAAPFTVRAQNHGFSPGQRIWLDGFAGSTAQFNGFVTVGDVTTDTFTLGELPSSSPAPNSFGPPVALPVHSANRAGTFVFELDFGSWTPKAEGAYRILIPGLGVSDAFEVRDDVWFRAGKASIGGLYNHRSGIALDGRFGFTRPVSFRPGSQVAVRLSKLPLTWSSNFHGGFISADLGGGKPWITDEAAPDSYWGGYMDAGDWDRRIDHLDASYLLLDVYESSADALRALPLGIPKLRDVLDGDLYGEADDLPDVLHEAIWTIDFFRRLQLPDGSVRGGIESSGHPLLGTPSYLEHLTVFAYAPDEISSYRYAGVAAKLAGILDRATKPRLAEVYRSSALSAWRAAENISSNRDAVYAEPRSLAEASGQFASTSWDVHAESLTQIAAEHRVAAAGSLFRLTGEDEYREIFEAGWAGEVEPYIHKADGAWEYYRAPHSTVNAGLRDRISALFTASAKLIVDGQNSFAYPSMKHPFSPIGWGQGLAPDYNQSQLLIRAHQIANDGDILRTMQVASAHILGANQVGLSFTTGLGHRNIKHPLHVDHLAMGVQVPDGITIYGWAPQADTSHEWLFGPPWTPLPISGTEEGAQGRRVSPNRFAMPFYEYLIEHPLLIMQQEYTVHQTIGTTAGVWLYLHAHGGEASSPERRSP